MNPLQSLVRITRKNYSYSQFASFDWFWGAMWRIWHFCDRKLHGYE
ncbi:MAG: hypothetical protein V8Q69_09135 [Bacteroides caccae]|nr:hypothetical protein [Bacteroides caccae]MCE8774436.1 hypothetical protein [Bacteroides caccae]